jgi:hypothetical protein
MKKKSLGVVILSMVVIFLMNMTDAFGPIGIAIVGIANSAIIMWLKKTSDSGVWLKNMSAGFWIVNIFGVVIMVGGSIVANQELFGLSEVVIAWISKGVITLNAAILALGTTTPMTIGDKTILSIKE